MSVTTTDAKRRPDAAWGAVWTMALCVAMLIASEFMPVSLLTPMAIGLGATEGQTGQAISISGLFAVAASLLVTTIAGKLNRKWVLVAMTAFMLLSLVLVAAAPNFSVLMIGRALLGLCIGGFWALATAVIMRLVPTPDMPRALALMYGGQAIAAAFGNAYNDFLRRVNVSYIIAGKEELDFVAAVLKIQKIYGKNELLLNGGGGYWSLLKEGLGDEVSIVKTSVADGSIGSASLFDANPKHNDVDPVGFELIGIQKLANGGVWSRYSVKESDQSRVDALERGRRDGFYPEEGNGTSSACCRRPAGIVR